MSIFNPIGFYGNWTESEKNFVSSIIMGNCPYTGEPAYNRWTFHKYDDGHFYAVRQTWDLGGMESENFSDLISKIKTYYHASN